MPLKARILLVSANTVTNPYPVFPLGLAFIEAALLRAGHPVRVWDQLLHSPTDLEDHLRWADAVGLSLRNVDNVSSTDPIQYIDEYKGLIARIRSFRSDIPLIAGGSAFSIFPEELLAELGLDWGIQGEAEKAMIDWLAVLAGSMRSTAVPGLVYRNGKGGIIANPPVSLKPEEIPSPRPSADWIGAYLSMGGVLNSQTQRGCALRCSYCTYPWIEGRCYRFRRSCDLVEEWRHLAEAGARYVFLTDSVFNTSRKHVEAFCEGLIKAGLQMNWGCFARPKNVDGALLDLMIASGLRHLEYGSDSFCDTTLKSYGKSFRLRDIIEASEAAAQRKLHVCHYVIFGGPGETERTIRETVANSRLLPDAPIFAFTGMRIYPHTPLYSSSVTKPSARELLQPYFYTPEGVSMERMREVISESTRGQENWFLSDHADDAKFQTAELRKRGKQGPLWEYLSITRRLNNQTESIQQPL